LSTDGDVWHLCGSMAPPIRAMFGGDWDYRPMAVKPDDPDEVRAKARETRLRAQKDTDPELRQVLVRVAAEYDELANAIEREMANLRPRK
jgi:hypothetical protein